MTTSSPLLEYTIKNGSFTTGIFPCSSGGYTELNTITLDRATTEMIIMFMDTTQPTCNLVFSVANEDSNSKDLLIYYNYAFVTTSPSSTSPPSYSKYTIQPMTIQSFEFDNTSQTFIPTMSGGIRNGSP